MYLKAKTNGKLKKKKIRQELILRLETHYFQILWSFARFIMKLSLTWHPSNVNLAYPIQFSGDKGDKGNSGIPGTPGIPGKPGLKGTKYFRLSDIWFYLFSDFIRFDILF